MASAPEARWHGDNYQSRIFWLNALKLLKTEHCVREVTFEADGPKAFDDVVVFYEPPVPATGPTRVTTDYYQIKWHVGSDGRFGYGSLVDPRFIGAEKFSILERLKQAKKVAAPTARFSLITTDKVSDGDPLGNLLCNTDESLLTERLFDGTTTDRGKMGRVRKLWREHLALNSNDELFDVLDGFRIHSGYRSLANLREEIEVRAAAQGLRVDAKESDFRFDELARRLKSRKLNSLTQSTLHRLCEEEGLFAGSAAVESDFLPIAVRSFLGPSAEVVGASPGNTLLLTHQFRQRYLLDDLDWQRDVEPTIEEFLLRMAKQSQRLRIILDAHASIAFLAGKIFDLKSGIDVELVQKGRVGTRLWKPTDGNSGDRLLYSQAESGRGAEIAIGIGVSQSVESQLKSYVGQFLPEVGTIGLFEPPAGAGQQTVANGAHAAALAEQISNVARSVRGDDGDALVHIFAACPNAMLFYLGQHHQGIAPCIIYEFDFDRQGTKTYQPSFLID